MFDDIKQHLNKKAICYFMPVRECLLQLSAASNFLIYCMFYKRFRKRLIHICTRNEVPHDTYSYSPGSMQESSKFSVGNNDTRC